MKYSKVQVPQIKLLLENVLIHINMKVDIKIIHMEKWIVAQINVQYWSDNGLLILLMKQLVNGQIINIDSWFVVLSGFFYKKKLFSRFVFCLYKCKPFDRETVVDISMFLTF